RSKATPAPQREERLRRGEGVYAWTTCCGCGLSSFHEIPSKNMTALTQNGLSLPRTDSNHTGLGRVEEKVFGDTQFRGARGRGAAGMPKNAPHFDNLTFERIEGIHLRGVRFAQRVNVDAAVVEGQDQAEFG